MNNANQKLTEEIKRLVGNRQYVAIGKLTIDNVDTIATALLLMDELPISGDGVSITPHTKLWHPKDIENGFDTPVTGRWLVQQKDNPPYHEYYSTPEAALAARSAK